MDTIEDKIKRVQAGEVYIFADIIEVYQQRIYMYCLRLGTFPATMHYLNWVDADTNRGYRVSASDTGLSKDELKAIAENIITTH